MRDLPATLGRAAGDPAGGAAVAGDEAAGDLEEIEGRGLSAIPGLVDCHTHACFGGDRVNEFSLRAQGGASYEELHAAGGGLLNHSACRTGGGGGALTAITLRNRSWMRAHGTTTFEGKSGYSASTTTLSSRSCARSAPRRRPDVARRAHGAARVRRRRCVRRLPARGGSARGGAARGGRRRLPQARLLRRPPVQALPRGVPRCRARASSARRPVHGVGRDRARDRAGARSVDHLEATSRAGVAQLAASDVAGVLLPASALFLGRPMPPGASARRRRGACRPRDRLQPGQRLLRQPATGALPRVHPAGAATPRKPCDAATTNAAHVLGRADRIGRLDPAMPAGTVGVLLDAPDWRHVAYHLAGDVVHTVLEAGAVARSAARHNPSMATQKQRRRRAKEKPAPTTTSSTSTRTGSSNP